MKLTLRKYEKYENSKINYDESVTIRIHGDTAEEIMQKFRDERDNNDLAKYTPHYFCYLEDDE